VVASPVIDLTVIILTLNEEVNLQRCLDSCNWVANRVIIDSGSDDKTLEIAQANGVRCLVHQTKPFLISEQRNWALDNATIQTEWVLFLDADEVITTALQAELYQIVANRPASNIVAYRLAPKFMFLDKWLKYSQSYPSWHDRLLKYGEVRYAGGVWEYFVFVHNNEASQIGYVAEPYLHFGFNKGIGDWYIKHERYASAEAKDVLISLGWQAGTISTTRKRFLRNLAAHFWPLRPLGRFVLMYIVRRGFLDGGPGLLYSLMMVSYELIVVLKIIELRRRTKNLPL
jgi:glycosyltransferase involved in cell wall biosynthesis